MSQPFAAVHGWKEQNQKTLSYSNWFLLEQKSSALLMVLVALGCSFCVWYRTAEPIWGLGVFFLLCMVGWSVFLPVYVEISSSGITRWSLGRKRFLPWEEIRAYHVLYGGVLLFPNNERYILESFRGYFVPIPPALSSEVLFRLRFYVDKTVE